GRLGSSGSMDVSSSNSVSFAVGRQSRWRTTTKKRPARRHFIRWPSVWAAMVYRLDANDAVYQRFIRCGSAKPVANYKETARSQADRKRVEKWRGSDGVL